MENTKFSEIYPLFLSQIDDYELAQVGEEEFSYVLKGYMQNAIMNLQDVMFDIDSIDFEKEEFGEPLSFIVKNFIAKSMKLEWLRKEMNSLELMRKSYGDRDFSATQGYNYLKELRLLEKDLSAEVQTDITQYSYREEFLGWLNE